MSEQNGKHSSEPSQAQASSPEVKTGESANSEKMEQPEVHAGEKLSAEEQMALYENALKEDDWGHQPC